MDDEKVKCSKCGKEISNDDKFCPNCGLKNENYEKENNIFILIDTIFIILCQFANIMNIIFKGGYNFIYTLYYFQIFVHIVLGVTDIVLNKNKNRSILIFASILVLLIATVFLSINYVR